MVARPFRHEAENRQLEFRSADRSASCRAAWSPTRSVCSRFSRTCCRMRSSSPNKAACACRCRSPTSGWSENHPVLSGGGIRRGFRGFRYGHRHSARKTTNHLRGLPAGRCRHQPQVRRHRPGTGHQPRTGQLAGRRDSIAQHARQRQHVHALSAADVCRALRIEPRDAGGTGLTAASAAPVGRCRDCRAAAVERIADDRDNLQPDDARLC